MKKSLSKSAITLAPRLSADQGNLLARMANMEKQKRIVLLVDPSCLIESGDFNELAAMAA